MALVETVSVGEVAVAGGTLILAAVTVIITRWQTKEARRVWERQVDREYKRKLLDEFEGWLDRVIRALNKEAYCTERWLKGGEEEQLKGKGELLEKLLDLSHAGFFLGEKGRRPFEEHELGRKFDEVRDKYGDCTDMLHDIVQRQSETAEEEREADCEMELQNMAIEFLRYIVGIREKERI